MYKEQSYWIHYLHNGGLETWNSSKEEIVTGAGKSLAAIAEDSVMEDYGDEAEDRDRFTIIVASKEDGSDARSFVVEVRRGESWTEMCDGSNVPVTIPPAPAPAPTPTVVPATIV